MNNDSKKKWDAAKALLLSEHAKFLATCGKEGALLDFRGADVTGAIFDGATLTSASSVGADMTDSRFTGARLRHTRRGGVSNYPASAASSHYLKEQWVQLYGTGREPECVPWEMCDVA